jgi:hypothetical protein
MLLFLGIGIAAYVAVSSPSGRAIASAAREAVKISLRAQKAPGTKELRAMGCKQAMVMNGEDMTRMTGHLDAGMSNAANAPFGDVVVCGVNPWSTAPKCEDVAARYVSAVGPRPKPFFVSVQQTGKAACARLFDGSGTLVEAFDARGAPVLPSMSEDSTPEE